ncbi:MAG: ATP-binding protein, partial [Planctomycetota bacterium]
LATLMSNLPGMAYRCLNDRDWTMEFVSEGCFELTGHHPADVVDNNKVSYAQLIHPDDQKAVWNDVQTAVEKSEPFRLVYRITTAAGHEKWVWEQGRGVFSDDGELLALEGFITDITERKRLEEQLRHAQKMEAVGQLAGGVAHDFNNILTAILGQVDLTKNRLDSPARVAAGLEQIDQAAQRAAALTRRLLALGQRQLSKLEVLDLNQILAEIGPMLRHLVSEDIVVEVTRAPHVDHIRADAGQIEQVIMNLVLNARDALSSGGRLTIETANVNLDDNYVAARTGANPGPHVMLAVSDTGCGMSAEVIERIFEPFFTTKAPGKGTGLGLWTVFGIVKHSGGHLWVYSEPGKGTTVKAYLPAVREPLALQQAVPAPAARGGSETVLVVEDESIVRRLTRRILEESGYQVLEAANGDTALQIAAEYDGCIHLMVTDVVMPDMNGLKLADALSNTRPDLRVLFVSGHPSNVLAHHGVSSADLELLEKPFGAEALLQRARELLDRDDGRPPAPNSP